MPGRHYGRTSVAADRGQDGSIAGAFTDWDGREWPRVLAAPATGNPRVHLAPLRHRDESAVMRPTRYPGEVAESGTAERHWFGPIGDRALEILHLRPARG
jgi:hypothetical protein